MQNCNGIQASFELLVLALKHKSAHHGCNENIVDHLFYQPAFPKHTCGGDTKQI